MTRFDVGVMVARDLLADRVGMAMHDVGFSVLDRDTSQVLARADPGDRVPGPVKAGGVLDDREIHRHEHPGTGSLLVDAPHDVGVGPAGDPVVSDGRDLNPALPERSDEAIVRQLFVEDEFGHISGELELSCRRDPADRLGNITVVEAVIVDQGCPPSIIRGQLRDPLNRPSSPLNGRDASELVWIYLDSL